MASGFVQRYKGKIAAQCIFVGLDGIRQYVQNSSASSASVVPPILQNAGVSGIICSSGSAVFTLEAPLPGVEKQIVASTISSGFLVASTAATFDGTNPVMKYLSTLGGTGAALNLIGLSTSRWGIMGMYPSSTLAWVASATT